MPLQHGKHLAMCTLVAPVIILYCFLLVVPVSALTRLHHILPTSQSQATLYSQLIHSFWPYIVTILCIFKILANYPIAFKQFIHNIMHLTNQVIAKENFPGSFHSQQEIDCPMKKLKTQKQLPRSTVSKKKNNNNDAPGNECKQQANLKQQSFESKASADWVVVKSENKKKKRYASLTPVDSVPTEPQQRRHSSPNTKSSTKITNKSMNNNKQNTKCRNKTLGQDLNQKQSKTTTTTTTTTTTSPVSRSQPWTNIVKKEEGHDDMPCLSDTESTTESVESPCISNQELSHHFTTTKRYYSPFSTGFDLGPSLQAKETRAELKVCQNEFSINNRLDEYLNTQQRQYTHKKSILNLLNPTSQVETTITPTCFKYFDDMMMSTSLYYHIEEEIPSQVLYNKKDWYAIH